MVRVGLLSLRNLLADGDPMMASDMVDAGLAKVVATRAMQVNKSGLVGEWRWEAGRCHCVLWECLASSN